MERMAMANERKVPAYANHLALTVRKDGNALLLSERYGKKRKIGTFRSWAAVERAIERHGDNCLRSGSSR
jgi:hypothetical protein